MKVIRAGTLGFCMGVRRAVEMALHASERNESGRKSTIYTLGPLIHNSHFLLKLQKKGVICLEEPFDFHSIEKASIVIIRAHGVPPNIEESLKLNGINVIDATCPNVKASQEKARFLAEKGYTIFLAGEENHAEIMGIKGYAASCTCIVIGNPSEAETRAAELAVEKVSQKESEVKIALIGQTTISRQEYMAIGEAIKRHFPKLEIADSICLATSERQKCLKELSGKVDALLIAGSKESANTRRLHSLAQELGKPAWLVESPADIPQEIKDYKTIGLSAGASVPDSLIDEIEEALIVL